MDGFQGISTQIVQGTKFQDANNTDFYVVPSQVSHLNNANFAGNIGVHGYDYQNGLPADFDGGVQTVDVYAHGQLAVGNNSVTNGFFEADGDLQASQFVSAQVIRPTYMATMAQPCNFVTIPGNRGEKVSFPTWMGDIAQSSDGSGRTLVCMNGIWQPMVATLEASFFTLPQGYNVSQNIGRHRFCALSDTFESDASSKKADAVRVLPGAYGSDGKYEWILSRGALGYEGGAANCFD